MADLNFERVYEFRFAGINRGAKAAVWSKIAPQIYQMMGFPKKILDPAGGMLEFIENIKAEEKWVVDLVDYNATQKHSDIKFIKSDIFAAPLPEHYFDGVFVSNFLEHLNNYDDIARLLKKLHTSLKPGGVIAILGPNYKFCYRDYFDFSDHVLPLSHISVMEHLYAAGFRIRTVYDRFLPLSFRGRLPPSPFLVGLYLAMPFFWRFFGKQFLIIAEK